MRHTFKTVAVLLACSLAAAPVFAQSGKSADKKLSSKEETVIIRKEKKDGRTIVEIKDGTVYVNGEAVVTVHDADAAQVRKKVIIEDGDGGDTAPYFSFDDEDRRPGLPGQRKAMLGVLTDPKSDKEGAFIKDVTPGSAAEKAGLRSGDVITHVDGKKIKDAGMLVMEIMAEHDPGDKVTINYQRDGKEQVTTAKLMPADRPMAMRSFRFNPDDMNGDMPNRLFRNFPFMAGDDAMPTPKLGLSVEDRADGEGVQVLSVKPGSAAAAAGLREGDVITRLEDDALGSVDELQMSMRGRKGGDKLKLEYQRAGKAATATVLLPKTVKRKDL